MSKKADDDLRDEVSAALEGVDAYSSEDGQTMNVSFPSREQMQRAQALSARLGYTADAANCPPCMVTMVNTLRKTIGLSPLVMSVGHAMQAARLRACLGNAKEGVERCPKLSRKTGTLGKFPFVQFRDATCTACGCNIYVKSDLKGFDCPLKRWPELKTH